MGAELLATTHAAHYAHKNRLSGEDQQQLHAAMRNLDTLSDKVRSIVYQHTSLRRVCQLMRAFCQVNRIMFARTQRTSLRRVCEPMRAL